jgi:hypothetical protein
MDRNRTAKYRQSDRRDDDIVPGTPAERIGLVWPLTRELALLSKKYDPDQKLQRNVTRLIRRETRKSPKNSNPTSPDKE